MGAVLAFWAVSLLVGLLALPIAFALLRRLPDAGAGLAIPLGLVIAGYVYFILRVASVLPFGRGGYVVAVALLGIIGAAVAGRDRRFLSTLRRTWTGWAVAAGVFTFFFFGYVSVRSYNAEINGTEQPMDLMYLNATLNSKEYPPQDSWLSGSDASYYYFGYLQVGLLTSVSGVPASTGYNLGLAYTFAAAAAAIASLGFALARWAIGTRGRKWAVAAGGLAIAMLLFLGSLSAIFELAAAHGETNADLYGKFGVEWLIPCAPGQVEDCFQGDITHRADTWYPSEFFFWWRGSRIIPDTITEFPFFSFLLGDLHPHVMSIPLVLLAIGVSLTAWRGRRPLSWRTHVREPWGLALLGLIFGALAFQNAWDILTFSALLAVAVLVRNMRRLPVAERRPGDRPPVRLPSLEATATYLLPIALLCVVLYIPWYATFSSQAGGLEPYIGVGTRPAHAFLQFGPLLAAALLVVTWSFARWQRQYTLNAAVAALWLPLLPFMVWLALAGWNGDLRTGLEARTLSGWITLAGYALTTWLLLVSALVLRERHNAGAAVAALAAVGALLLFGAELFYIKDIFGTAPRLNTVFKLSYQAWMLLSLAGAVATVVALQRAWERRSAAGWLAVPVLVLAGAGLVYAVIALPNRTEGFDKETHIDGLADLARNDPSEYALTEWVQQHTAPGDIVIEGSGRTWQATAGQPATMVDANVDYTDAGRIASRAGRETLIGWFFHEIQWRADTPANRAEFTGRQDEVDSVYTRSDGNAILRTLHEAGASYVVLGRLERAKYPASTLPNFDNFLDVAFESGGLKVYRVPTVRMVATS
jgi:YYY domain-containing protein